jgi:phosphatidylserine decarboxylase
MYGLNQYFNLNLISIIMIEIVLIIMLITVIGLYRFYRDPERVPPEDHNVIISPADGRVLYIKQLISGKIPYSVKRGNAYKLEELTNTKLLDKDHFIIGIMMTILDVHVNRAPITGRVIDLIHTPGQFMSLRKELAPIKNERLTTVIQQGEYTVAVVQIASRLVRRIQTYLKVGQKVELAQRLGMIRFGSQVDLIIPLTENLKFNVKPGDEVKAGSSIIAHYRLPFSKNTSLK